jgi:hypothetical protein
MSRSSRTLVFVGAFPVVVACLGLSCQKDEGAVVVEDAASGRSETFVTLPEAGPTDEIDIDGAVSGNDGGGDAASSDSGQLDGAAGPDLAADSPAGALPNGQPCRTNGSCSSNFCVDGVCCDSACDTGDAVRCNACLMAKTGQKDGVCAPDNAQNKIKCGESCGLAAPNVPGVVAMYCVQGRCVVSPQPVVVATCAGSELDLCSPSFSCIQSTARTARCMATLCPQAGGCCCALPGNATQRLCLSQSLCNNGRVCVSQ